MILDSVSSTHRSRHERIHHSDAQRSHRILSRRLGRGKTVGLRGAPSRSRVSAHDAQEHARTPHQTRMTTLPSLARPRRRTPEPSELGTAIPLSQAHMSDKFLPCLRVAILATRRTVKRTNIHKEGKRPPNPVLIRRLPGKQRDPAIEKTA